MLGDVTLRLTWVITLMPITLLGTDVVAGHDSNILQVITVLDAWSSIGIV